MYGLSSGGQNSCLPETAEQLFAKAYDSNLVENAAEIRMKTEQVHRLKKRREESSSQHLAKNIEGSRTFSGSLMRGYHA